MEELSLVEGDRPPAPIVTATRSGPRAWMRWASAAASSLVAQGSERMAMSTRGAYAAM